MNPKPTYAALSKQVTDLERESRTLKATHRERLKFEELLTELSATFVRKMPAEEVDAQIEAVLQRIGQLLDVDRTEFIQHDEDTGKLVVTHSWKAAGMPRIDRGMDLNEAFPWYLEKVRSGEPIIFAEDLPLARTRDQENLAALGLKSGLIIPYHVEGALWGAVAFGSYKKRRLPRAEEYIQRLRLLGEIIFHALLRKQADLKLKAAFT